MNKVSKIISVALVLVLALSVMVMPTAAGTWDNGDDGVVKFTFSAEKYEGVDTMGVDATDIYAVTMYINSTAPITDFTVPVYYDATKFTPVDGTDMSILDWEYTVDHSAGLNGVAYEVPAGSDLADTNKYAKANVLPANRTVNARGAISGLGKGAFSSAITNLTDTDKSVSTVWWGGLDTNKYGVIVLQYSPQANYCNLQAYGEDTPFLTFLFKLNAGADPVGGEFGFIEGSTREYDVVTETVQTKFYYDGTSTVGYPEVHASSCTYEETAAPSPVVKKSSQIRFNNGLEGDANFSFDVRTRAAMTAADFAAICGDDATAVNAIESVGFVYADSSVGLTVADAKAAATGASVDGAVVVEVEHIQKTGTEYVWTCLLTDADKADAVDAVGYITVGGTTYLFDAVSSTDFSALYNTYYPQYAATLS
ncbi:MAG: hypothetical protein IKU41_00135 [Clostridia bacterium]|nr:hypothetical protein [Clostridia bacterium]